MSGSTSTTVCPISRLSDDVLGIIFETTALARPRTRVEQKFATVATAVAISHVSRRWRLVVLDLPTLWGRISYRRLDAKWVPLQLERSRDAPLTISWTAHANYAPEELDVLASILNGHHDHIRVLRLCLDRRAFEKIFLLLFQLAPMLEQLSLECRRDPDARGPAIRPPSDVQYYFKFGDLLSAYCPNLRSLHLCNVIMGWPQSAKGFSQLTHLTLDPICPIGLFRTPWELSLDDLLDLFSRAPMLEIVDISRGIGTLRSTEGFRERDLRPIPKNLPKTTRHVRLPEIRELHLAFPDIVSAVELSRHISVHPQCIFAYQCGWNNIQPPLPFAVLVRNIIPAEVFQPLLRDLVINFDQKSLSAALECRISGNTYHTIDKFMNRLTLVNDAGYRHADTLHAIFHHLYDLTQLRSLRLTSNIEVSISIWNEIFFACPTIEELVIDPESAVGFIDKHAAIICERIELQNVASLLPALAILNIYRPRSGWNRMTLTEDNEENLAAVLRARKRHGFGLRKFLYYVTPENKPNDWTGCAEGVWVV